MVEAAVVLSAAEHARLAAWEEVTQTALLLPGEECAGGGEARPPRRAAPGAGAAEDETWALLSRLPLLDPASAARAAPRQARAERGLGASASERERESEDERAATGAPAPFVVSSLADAQGAHEANVVVMVVECHRPGASHCVLLVSDKSLKFVRVVCSGSAAQWAAGAAAGELVLLAHVRLLSAAGQPRTACGEVGDSRRDKVGYVADERHCVSLGTASPTLSDASKKRLRQVRRKGGLAHCRHTPPD
jgi:hypothetical protein